MRPAGVRVAGLIGLTAENRSSALSPALDLLRTTAHGRTWGMDFEYKKIIEKYKERFYFHLIGQYELHDEIPTAKKIALNCIVNYSFYRKGKYFLILIRLYFPSLFIFCKKFMRSLH